MQGSRVDAAIAPQDYRKAIKEIIAEKVPGRTVYCPLETHRDSPQYTDEQARRVFGRHIELACRCGVFIAFLPDASLGTAVEMWECHHRGVPIITITPMKHNWVVRLLSSIILGDLEEFREWLSEDALDGILSQTNSTNSGMPRIRTEGGGPSSVSP